MPRSACDAATQQRLVIPTGYTNIANPVSVPSAAQPFPVFSHVCWRLLVLLVRRSVRCRPTARHVPPRPIVCDVCRLGIGLSRALKQVRSCSCFKLRPHTGRGLLTWGLNRQSGHSRTFTSCTTTWPAWQVPSCFARSRRSTGRTWLWHPSRTRCTSAALSLPCRSAYAVHAESPNASGLTCSTVCTLCSRPGVQTSRAPCVSPLATGICRALQNSGRASHSALYCPVTTPRPSQAHSQRHALDSCMCFTHHGLPCRRLHSRLLHL